MVSGLSLGVMISWAASAPPMPNVSMAAAPDAHVVAPALVPLAPNVSASVDQSADFEHTTPFDANAGQPDAPSVKMIDYVVEPGDNVRTIAKQFGVTNETIIWVNDLTNYDLLYVGQKLQILPFSGLIHEVRPGDTVASVANAYEAKVDDVIRVNQLKDPYVIVVSQKLVVPGGYRSLVQAQPTPDPATVDASAAPEGPVVQAPDGGGSQLAAVAAPVRKLPVLGNTPQEQFISSIGQAAVDSDEQTGVPASVTIAQAILESYWGSSRLSTEANNYFGIKAQTKQGPAGAVWFDVWEVIGGRNVVQSEAFRKYNNITESFVDHGQFFLENGRYARAMAVKDDARQFAIEINRAGYATDPNYATKLIALMDKYDLYRYDQ